MSDDECAVFVLLFIGSNEQKKADTMSNPSH